MLDGGAVLVYTFGNDGPFPEGGFSEQATHRQPFRHFPHIPTPQASNSSTRSASGSRLLPCTGSQKHEAIDYNPQAFQVETIGEGPRNTDHAQDNGSAAPSQVLFCRRLKWIRVFGVHARFLESAGAKCEAS